jgi:hypothetical protein
MIERHFGVGCRLYKYPQDEFPYAELALVNRARSREDMINQSLGHLDAASALEEHHWPFARPYRRLAVQDASATTAASSSR